jgi:hypothetical protein
MSSRPHKLMQLGYSVFAKVRRRLAEDAGWRCTYCGVEVIIGAAGGAQLATIEHKIPLSRGGTWKRGNLTCACYGCNNRKGNLTVEEFMALSAGERGRAVTRSPAPRKPPMEWPEGSLHARQTSMLKWLQVLGHEVDYR